MDKSVCVTLLCLCQLEEDHRYNVWRQTSGRVWLWRGESFFDLKKTKNLAFDGIDVFTCIVYFCLQLLHCPVVCRWGKAAAQL